MFKFFKTSVVTLFGQLYQGGGQLLIVNESREWQLGPTSYSWYICTTGSGWLFHAKDRDDLSCCGLSITVVGWPRAGEKKRKRILWWGPQNVFLFLFFFLLFRVDSPQREGLSPDPSCEGANPSPCTTILFGRPKGYLKDNTNSVSGLCLWQWSSKQSEFQCSSLNYVFQCL